MSLGEPHANFFFWIYPDPATDRLKTEINESTKDPLRNFFFLRKTTSPFLAFKKHDTAEFSLLDLVRDLYKF